LTNGNSRYNALNILSLFKKVKLKSSVLVKLKIKKACEKKFNTLLTVQKQNILKEKKKDPKTS
jgi:hypothetical protein